MFIKSWLLLAVAVAATASPHILERKPTTAAVDASTLQGNTYTAIKAGSARQMQA